MTKTVTIAQTGAVKSVEFSEGMTVDQAISAAGLTVGRGREVRVNSAAAEGSQVLSANDTILIVGSIRGASQTVTIAQTGAVKSVEFSEGMTVDQAIEAAGLTVGRGREVRVNSAAAEGSQVLSANDTILIVGSIRGA